MPPSHPCPVQRDPEIDERYAGKNEQHDENVNDYDGVGEQGRRAQFVSLRLFVLRSARRSLFRHALVVSSLAAAHDRGLDGSTIDVMTATRVRNKRIRLCCRVGQRRLYQQDSGQRGKGKLGHAILHPEGQTLNKINPPYCRL